jgi:exodeoxyribonuclease V alpha subunit
MSTAFLQFAEGQRKNIFAPVDVEFCRFLAEIEPNIHENVLLAGCFVSAAYRQGDVCILLDDIKEQAAIDELDELAELSLHIPDLKDWLKQLEESNVVGEPCDFRPLILDEAHRLYFHKLWRHEQILARSIWEKVDQEPPPLDIPLSKAGLQHLFNSETEIIDWQKVAVAVSASQLFTVISGGPGTGKTSTVMRLLILLLEQGRKLGSIPAIALAAPTGKAAIRLQESIENIPDDLLADEEIKAHIPTETVTLHHLLGASRHTTKFRYHEENPLPYDCVIVDEASMVDQTLMTRLMQALRDKTRLVLLGDKDQLASVEAGSVFGDICGEITDNRYAESMVTYLEKLGINLPAKHVSENGDGAELANHINLLKKSYRFPAESGIGRLVKAINAGDPDEAWELLNDDQFSEISFIPFENYQMFLETMSDKIINQYSKVRSAQSPDQMLDLYGEFKILGAHRTGPWGVETINQGLEQKLRKHNLVLTSQNWYEGRPIIINTNDYSVGLSNGDIGVCVKGDNDAQTVYFGKGNENMLLPLSRLPAHSTAFALTVHKSQGSEFDEILLVLPDESSKLLHRELVYTAVSRAREKITVVGSKQALQKAVAHRVEHYSGLRDYLWK